jgi:3-hydroxybutyryl-CoA dehydrogenase
MLREIKSMAVIGAGTMGQGIAQVFASGGFDTLLFDANGAMVDAAVAKIEMGLSLSVQKGKVSEEEKTITLAKIKPVHTFGEVRADLIIEAIVEDLATKQKLFQGLENQNAIHTILCTNTSSLSVTKIFEHCVEQCRCLGVHFFNPAHAMKLVELISGERTSLSILDQVSILLKQLGKTTVTAKDSPGFIVNRVARHFYLESLKILEEGGSMEDIDTILKSSGFKMGPFELMDLIGLDVNLAVSTAVYEGFNQNAKYKPSHMQVEKVKAGHLGRKSGKGFYDYKKN